MTLKNDVAFSRATKCMLILHDAAATESHPKLGEKRARWQHKKNQQSALIVPKGCVRQDRKKGEERMKEE